MPWLLLRSYDHSYVFLPVLQDSVRSKERPATRAVRFVPWEVLKCFSVPLSTTYITCPADPKKTLGIKLPFLVMIIKNLKKYFTFEVQVRNVQRGGPSRDQ